MELDIGNFTLTREVNNHSITDGKASILKVGHTRRF